MLALTGSVAFDPLADIDPEPTRRCIERGNDPALPLEFAVNIALFNLILQLVIRRSPTAATIWKTAT
jgi:hypothetical protein